MARIKHGTLTADTVETIELDANYSTVEVMNVDGVDEIYVAVDGAEPDIEADDCEVLPAQISALEVRSRSQATPTVVKLKSEGTPKFSVKGVQ